MSEWDLMLSAEEKDDRLTAIKIVELLDGVSVERALFSLNQAENMVKTQSKVNIKSDAFVKLVDALKTAKTLESSI